MKSNWSLFYKFAGDTPREFYEVRQIGASVWTARGKVKTMGESSSTAFTNVDAAKAAYAGKCCQIVSEGFSLTRDSNKVFEQSWLLASAEIYLCRSELPVFGVLR